MTKKKVRKLKTAKAGVDIKASSRTPEASSVKGDITAVSVKQGKVQALMQYFRDVRAEFDKISWATKKETTSMTVAVLAISIFFAAYLGLVDIILSKLVGVLID